MHTTRSVLKTFALMLLVVVAQPVAGLAQATNEAQIAALLQKRQGGDIGAKPCKYDALPRPSVLVSPQQLQAVRRAVLQSHGNQAEIFLKHTKVNADRWLHRDIVIPSVGGWAHYFFCTDGNMLELPADQKFDPNAPSKCPVCGKTYLNDKILGARRFFEHYWLADATRDLALTYAIVQKPEYAQKAAEILLKYADAYPKELGDGGFQINTLTEANSVIPLAEAYDLICDEMTPAQRDHVERDFFWPVAQSLTQAGFGGNWGSWHLSAIGVIGYATRHQRFIDFATAQFKLQIADQLGDDGLWPESIGTYHFYALEAFISFAEAAANCGDDLYDWEPKPGKGLKAMFEAPLRFAYPNLRVPAINDGWYDAWLPRDQYTLAYHRYHLPEFAWAIRTLAQEGKSGNPGEFIDRNNRYLLYTEPLPAEIIKPVFTSTNFPVLGISILRQGSDTPDETMMTLHYGPFLGHGHYDKMGVTLFANGQLLVPAYGTSGYGIPLSQFLQSAPGHNTIVIDGKNQPRTHDDDLVAFKDTPDFKLAAARSSEVANGVTWTRAVMLADHYAVIWDKLDGTAPHQYDWFLHAEGKGLSFGDRNESSSAVKKKEFPYPFITDARKSSAVDTFHARWDGDTNNLSCWIMGQPGQTAFTGQFPTPDDRHVPVLVLRQKSRHAEFVTVLQPQRTAEPFDESNVQFSREGDTTLVTVKIRGREDRVRLGNTVKYSHGDTSPLSVKLTD